MSAEIAIRPLDAEDLDGFCALMKDFLTHAGNPIPPDEDLRRLIVWLDSNSEFYGSYDNTVAQAAGELVYPTLE